MRVSAPSFLWLLMVGLLIQAAPSLQAADEPTHEQVTLRPGGDLTAEELATILGAYVWKFDVSFPDAPTKSRSAFTNKRKEWNACHLGSACPRR